MRSSRRFAAASFSLLLLSLSLLFLGGCAREEPARLVVHNVGDEPLQSIQVSLGAVRENLPELAAGDRAVLVLPEERPLEVDLRWRTATGVGYASQNITPLLATGDDVLVELAAGGSPLFRRAGAVDR